MLGQEKKSFLQLGLFLTISTLDLARMQKYPASLQFAFREPFPLLAAGLDFMLHSLASAVMQH